MGQAHLEKGDQVAAELVFLRECHLIEEILAVVDTDISVSSYTADDELTVKFDSEISKLSNSLIQQRQNVLLNALLFATYCLRNISKQKGDTDKTANYTAEAQCIRNRQKYLATFGLLPSANLSLSEPTETVGNSRVTIVNSNNSAKTNISQSLFAQCILEDNSDIFFLRSISLFRENICNFLEEIISFRYSVRACCAQFIRSVKKVKSTKITEEALQQGKVSYENFKNLYNITDLAVSSNCNLKSMVFKIRKLLEDVDILRDTYEERIAVLDKILVMVQKIVDASNSNCDFKVVPLDTSRCDQSLRMFDDNQCKSALFYANLLLKACDLLRQELKSVGVIIEDLKN